MLDGVGIGLTAALLVLVAAAAVVRSTTYSGRSNLARGMTKDPPYAIAAPDPEQAEPLKAIAALRTITCSKADMEALTAFYDSWMLEVQNRRG